MSTESVTTATITARDLAGYLLRAAELHERSWIGVEAGGYSLSILRAAERTVPEPWRKVVYLMLSGAWNMSLDWAEEHTS